ncbi:hypothetical protein U1769_02190 [Sphingomonas sp. ZT3P38]|uniref:hypothetical protein n=1 Tax=Parasphingomonas zepuensis TaxID=3096161 RepID=UPI002FC9D436
MLAFLALLLAAKDIDLHQVAADSRPIAQDEVLVPVSDSVRAATWDELAVKPSVPKHVRVACIVWAQNGAPGACVDASRLQPGQTSIDWIKAREDQSAADANDLAGADLRALVNKRLAPMRLRQINSDRTRFVVRIFEETIGPADARPPFVPGTSLTLGQVTLAEPLDGSLIEALYPMDAIRNGVQARVRIACRIQPNLALLCRDPGTIATSSGSGNDSPDIVRSLRFASYQLASTIRLKPKANDGSDVVGRDLQIGLSWQMPR